MKVTREGKPYCPDHIEEHQPYVVGVIEQLGAMDEEENRIKRQGFKGVDVRGLLAEELMIKLMSDYGGTVTVERISREVMRAPLVVSAIFVGLARIDRVSLCRTVRGTLMITAVLGEASNQQEDEECESSTD